MRILHVISTVDPRNGGPSEAMQQRGRVLKEMGHDVEVLTADAPDAEFLKAYTLKVYAQGPVTGPSGYAAGLKSWLADHYKEYDAVIASGIWQYSTMAVYQTARRLKLPHWVFTHGMLDPYFMRGAPLKALKKKLYWLRLYPAMRDAAAVFFTCEEERLLARQAVSPFNVREYVVKYGTKGPEGPESAHVAAFRNAFPQLAGTRFLLFLSRIDPKKGVDLLVRAFQTESGAAPDLHLVLAGPVKDDYRRELEALIAAGPAKDRIHWTGLVSADVKWGAFRSAEAFILPSHQENFGVAIAEALACGLPVLISRRVNIWREIEADGAGFVAEDTLEGSRGLLQKWIATPPDERRAMSERAVACFTSRYTVEQSAISLIEGLEKTRPVT